MAVSVVIFFIILLQITSISSENVDQKLVLTQIIWRHGDRTPTHNTQNDLNTTWPQGFGQLTPRGMKQHYKLGQLIRKTYIEEMKANDWFGKTALNENYRFEQIYIRSDDEPRTLQSAYSNLAGMFPTDDAETSPQNDAHWPQGYTPVPVHTVKHDKDHLLNTGKHCDMGTKLQIEAYNNTYLNELFRVNANFIYNLGVWTGEGNMTVHDVQSLYGTILIEKYWNGTSDMNMTTPSWTNNLVTLIYGTCPTNTTLGLTVNDVDDTWPTCKHVNVTAYDALEKLNYASRVYRKDSAVMARLYGGDLLTHLNGVMEAKWKCATSDENKNKCTKYSFNDETKMDLNPMLYIGYSAHDTTLVALLRTLGNATQVINIAATGTPQYSAAVAIELWAEKKTADADWSPAVKLQYYNGIYYGNQSFNDPNWQTVTNTISGCPNTSNTCPLSEYLQRSQPFKPSANGRKADCDGVVADTTTMAVRTTTKSCGNNNSTLLIAVVVLAIVSAVLFGTTFALGLCLCLHKKKMIQLL